MLASARYEVRLRAASRRSAHTHAALVRANPARSSEVKRTGESKSKHVTTDGGPPTVVVAARDLASYSSVTVACLHLLLQLLLAAGCSARALVIETETATVSSRQSKA